MIVQSEIIDIQELGVILDLTMEGHLFKVYAYISEPDLERVADIVPAEQFEKEGDVHVTAIASPDEAQRQFEDLAFNMNIGDTLVFLCDDGTCLAAVLQALGQTLDDDEA